MLTHIDHHTENKEPSDEYIKCLDIIYDELGFTKRIDPSAIDFYVRLESIDKLCNYRYSIRFDVAAIMSFISMDPVVELMTRERLSDGIYAKVNVDNIRVYKGKDGNFYTAEKLKISDLELTKMKSLRDFFEEQEIYESLLRSWDTKTVKQKLIDFLEIYDDEIEIVKPTSKKSPIVIDAKNINLDSRAEDELKQFANLIGYTCSIDRKYNEVTLIPYHPESANEIVKDNKYIVYHLTSKYFYDKIKHKKYIPLRSSVNFPAGDRHKDRTYCFCGNLSDLKYHIEGFRLSSARTRRHNKLSEYYDKNILLTIDVSDSDIDWYYDPAYTLSGRANAVFTRDYIETKNIVNVQELKNGRLEV